MPERGGKPDRLQDIIDDPAQRVHHHLPGHAGDDRAHPQGQDENRPVDPNAPLDAVEQKPDRQAEADRPSYGSDRVDHRVLHAQPEEPRGEDLLVIFQPDELEVGQAFARRVEAEVESIKKRIDKKGQQE